MNHLYKFYRSKKIFITGHTGFKGTWLTLWLKLMGARVCGFSLAPPTSLNFYDLSGLEKKITSITGDVREPAALKKAVFEFNPDIVIHMAAQALVRQSYADPFETYSTNIMGTVNILEAVRLEKTVRAIVNVTSDKCYENKNYLRGYKETDPMGGFDPYSSSKGCSELITSAYSRSFFSTKASDQDFVTAVASARAGNVIGGGDFAKDRLIPDMVKAFLKKDIVHIRNPHAVRPWQHVLEPLMGYLLLAKKLYKQGDQFSGPWNFGPDAKGLSNVGDLADKFAAIWGGKAAWRHDKKSHPHESALLELDPSKAKELLGWQTIWDTDKALEYTAAWYKCFKQNPEKIAALSEEQIRAYEKQARVLR